MFQLIASGFKQFGRLLLAIVAPTIALRRAECNAARLMVTTIHVVGMLSILIGLGILQWAVSLDHYVRSSSWLFRHGWLPIVASMLYSLAWSLWYLVRVMKSPKRTDADGELRLAWKQAKDRIARAGIDFRSTPLFLTLGRPTGGIHNFFSASGFPLAVPPTPADDDAPIRICGNHDALFICCDRSSLLDEFVTRMSRQPEPSKIVPVSGTRHPKDAYVGTAHDWERPSGDAISQSMMEGIAGPTERGGSPSPATAVLVKPVATSETSTAMRIESQLDALQKQIAAAELVIQPTQRADSLTELETQLAAEIDQRLEGLCNLLIEDREPLCPINGIVLMVPLSATDDAEIADHVGMRIEHDLRTIVNSLQMGVSIQLVLTGLERCIGTKALLARFPKAQKDRRLGAEIPIAPASEPQAQEMLIDRTSQWLCEELFPPLVARLFNRDSSDEDGDFALQQGNQRLHQFMISMRERQQWLSRMMRRTVASQGKSLRLRGCFFAATGDDAVHGQAFVTGIIPMILACQNEVRWLDGRRRRDYWQWVSVVAGYAGIALVTTGLLAALMLS